jgi:ribokinase
MDMVAHLDNIPIVGETILGSNFEIIPGGKGANQAVSIGKLSGEVSMMGVVGKDANGEALINNLKQNNVNTKQVLTIDFVNTGIAFVMINKNAYNSIVVIPGANSKFEKELIDKKEIEKSDIILAQMEIPIETIKFIFRIGKEYNKYIILNPAPARKIPDDMIKLVDLIIPNETEFEILTGYSANSEESLLEGVKVLFGRGVSEVIVTIGEKGSRYFNKSGDDIYTPGIKVDAIDTTAAGDSFIGAYTTSISRGENIAKALKFATKAASITVSIQGAQPSLPSLNMINNLVL